MKKFLTFIKITGLLLFNSAIFLINDPLAITLLLIVLLIINYRIKFTLIKRLKNILPAAFFIILFQILFNTSITLDQRIILGYIASARLIAISLSVLLFLSATSLLELVRLFNFLPKNARLLLTLTSYFIPRVLDEADTIKSIQKSRGMKLNDWNIIQSLASLIIPLIHRVFIRSEAISFSMLSRGFEDNEDHKSVLK